MIQFNIFIDIHIYDSALMPHKRHLCENNPCSHICLLAANNSFTCACPDNMKLHSNGRHCITNSATYKIAYGAIRQLIVAPYKSFGGAITNKDLSVFVDKIAFNLLNGDIFVADNRKKMIVALDEYMQIEYLITEHIQRVSSMSFGKTQFHFNTPIIII
jgi:hypothetical protein